MRKTMTTKEIAKQVIDNLPNDASMDDIMYALYVKDTFERGVREMREGEVIPHEVVKQRLQKWLK